MLHRTIDRNALQTNSISSEQREKKIEQKTKQKLTRAKEQKMMMIQNLSFGDFCIRAMHVHCTRPACVLVADLLVNPFVYRPRPTRPPSDTRD